jgi:hypothetical protein
MRNILLSLLLLSSLSLHAQRTNTRREEPATDIQHIATFTPVGVVVAYGHANPVFGIDYEYIFNPEAGIGFQLPLVFGYEGPEQGDYILGNNYNHTTVFAAPGIRIHAPIGRRRHAEFITGPSVIIGNMHFRPVNGYYGSTGTVSSAFNYNLLGIAANNSLNIYKGHFVFGFDARVGTLVESHEDSRFFIQLGMHFGGKF